LGKASLTQLIVVNWVTLSTANNNNNNLTTKNYNNGNGLYLSRSEGGYDFPANLPPNDRPEEIGDRILPPPHIQGPPEINILEANPAPIPDEMEDIIETQPKRPRRPKIKKKTKATLKIASLNMRGRGDDKWNHINQIIREKRIGVLATQETHLDDNHVDRLHNLFNKRIKIYYSTDPHQLNAKGVAIVLNKEITNTEDVEVIEIIPGRALLIQIPWHTDLLINILTIYAPNTPADNEAFWNTIHEKWQREHLPKPDIMLGDHNLVEDPIDRLPCHADNAQTVEALQNLKSQLLLHDGWRRTHPTTKAYTYLQKATGSQSRIDRIYVTEKIFKNSFDWEINTSGITTDHQMVSVQITDDTIPFVGKGRWTIPLNLLKNKKLMQEIQYKGKILEANLEKIKNRRTDEDNPQAAFKKFKDEITQEAKKAAKIMIPKIEKDISTLKKKLTETLNNTETTTGEKQLQAMLLQEEMDTLEKARHMSARSNIAVRNRLEGETISKYWTQINKAKTPRDTIQALKYPESDPAKYEKNSHKMAQIAQTYHENLQIVGLATGEELQHATEHAHQLMLHIHEV
jgi:exonuclease III